MAADEDYKRAYELLNGVHERDAKRRYFDPGSKEEELACKALARLLRSDEPFPRELGILLAAHFDGEAFEYRTAPALQVRQIVVQRRLQFTNPGKQADQSRFHILLAAGVSERMAWPESKEHRPKKIIYGQVAEKYGVSDQLVRKAWAEHKSMFRPFEVGNSGD
jgi:hypothetical protein